MLKRQASSAQSSTTATSPLTAAADEALARVAEQHQGSRAELAAQLGISERSLYRKLKAIKSPL
jgi:transcriptional regulator with PAS, ATPase and Fis domain